MTQKFREREREWNLTGLIESLRLKSGNNSWKKDIIFYEYKYNNHIVH